MLFRSDKNKTPTSVWYIDCFYMFRSFVKLSSKELPGIDETTTMATVQKPTYFWESASAVDPLALHNKILSLELQLQAIECAGPVFCNGEKFIQLVQSQNGSIGLFKNCMSQCTQVAYVSQQVFLIMCYKFKSHIKDEIQAFMSNIFFRVIESENSSFTQKALVLESLRSLCNDPFLLSQLFLNYDCDFDSMNLYKDIVEHLAQLCAKSSMLSLDHSRMKQRDLEENTELSLAGSEVLVTILQAFLKALNVETNDEDIIDIAGKKIRRDLNLEEVMASSTRRFLNFRRSSAVRASILSAAAEAAATSTNSKVTDTTITSGIAPTNNFDDHNVESCSTRIAYDINNSDLHMENEIGRAHV